MLKVLGYKPVLLAVLILVAPAATSMIVVDFQRFHSLMATLILCLIIEPLDNAVRQAEALGGRRFITAKVDCQLFFVHKDAHF
ncbi:hypothetical protein P8S54_08375 [Thiomicrospira sp. R3]|uniref:hypothetical protein n=1 Tax=Thiomicrospira sp. R3 TaxID=3035472 RepID=UPI00259B691A|nr:hypothetical protein [Thiomicrospira sp. R3]WFE68229.1 hypothetical protein P8S54_08375 [Thiomicrospira sp. R3]